MPVMETGPRFLSIPWSGPTPIRPRRRRPSCSCHCTLTSTAMELARVDVRETASQVFVTVLARWRPLDAGRDTQPEPDLKRTATAALKSPLGDRALVHAPHDDAPR